MKGKPVHFVLQMDPWSNSWEIFNIVANLGRNNVWGNIKKKIWNSDLTS
jgi:hypothetical protein